MSDNEENFPSLTESSPSPDDANVISENLLEQALLAEDFAATSSGSDNLVEQSEAVAMQPLQTSETARNSGPGTGITYNGTYMQSGSFTLGTTGRVVIRWRQSPPIKGQKYPWRAQAISYEIYKDGKRLTGWRLTGAAYLDSNGKVHLPVRGPSGASRVFKSTQSFFSQDFKTLVKVMDKFRAECLHIEKHDWNNLPFAFRNKEGKIVATESTLLLGGLIKKIGAEAIANSKKESRPFADRVHDNILRLSDNKTMGGLVKRILGVAGLQLHDHPTRGRSLIVGERSAAGANPGDTQYETNAGLVSGAPLNRGFIDALNRIAHRMNGRTDPTDQEVDEVLRLYNRQFEGEEGEDFASNMANYLIGQRSIFPPGGVGDLRSYFRFQVRMIFLNVQDYRNGNLPLHGLQNTILIAQRNMRHFRLNMRPEGLVNLILQMPGFEITQNARRNNARELLVNAAERWRLLRPLVDDELNRDLWTQILLVAGWLSIFAISGWR
jgi:hypothetical protein